MTITICRFSALLGLILGLSSMAAAWYGTTLASRAVITQAMLAQARCDPTGAGFVSITFIDGSQFTCVPAQQMPPTSREAAAQRRKGGRG